MIKAIIKFIIEVVIGQIVGILILFRPCFGHGCFPRFWFGSRR
jgi:hypothetical protein